MNELLVLPGRRAARPPDRLTVSQWAAKHRIIGAQNAIPGPWTNDVTPYLAEIMDSVSEPAVERVTLMTSTQVGKTETLLNALGYVVDQDPGPAMFVMPREEDRDYMVGQRVKPMIEESAAIAAHLTGRDWDVKREQIGFDRCTVYFVGANSPAGLSSRPIRFLFMDEIDKYPMKSGREADPLSLAEERTRTFWNRKIVRTSTPTTKAGNVWREWERSDRRRFHVPCPHCRRFQVFAMANLRWPDDERDPERVKREGLGHYFCAECSAEITDVEKPRMLRAGVWVPDGAELHPDGTVTGAPRTTHRGYHLSALYSPFVTWSEIAAKWIDAQGDIDRLLNFVNSWLGEPWEERLEEIKEERLAMLALPYPAGAVPEGAIVLTAGVDVQQDTIYYEVRAWGANEESWLVKASKAVKWETLADEVLRTQFAGAGPGGELHSVRLMCIDSAYRTDEVYDFARAWRDVVRPTKGRDTIAGLPYQANKVERHPVTGAPFVGSVLLWHVNTEFFKDRLARYIHGAEGEPARWHLHERPAAEYLRHLSSEHKVMVRDSRTKTAKSVWQRKPGHRANHWFDAAVLSLTAAHMLGTFDVRVRPQLAPPEPPPEPLPRAPRQGGGFVGAKRGWSAGGKGWMRR